MRVEIKAFNIPPQVVKDIERKVNDYQTESPSQGLDNYAYHIELAMTLDHPPLQSLMEQTKKRSTTDSRAYKIGIAIGYDTIMQAAILFRKNTKLTPDDLEIHKLSVIDFMGKEETDQDWPEHRFKERLQTSSEFVEYYEVLSRTFPRLESRQSFLRGIYDGVMPILAIIDRRELERALWKEETESTNSPV